MLGAALAKLAFDRHDVVQRQFAEQSGRLALQSGVAFQREYGAGQAGHYGCRVAGAAGDIQHRVAGRQRQCLQQAGQYHGLQQAAPGFRLKSSSL